MGNGLWTPGSTAIGFVPIEFHPDIAAQEHRAFFLALTGASLVR
jgi:hypothetical protein